MYVKALDSVEKQQVTDPAALGASIRILIGQPDGAPNFAMRTLEIQPGGYTPHHSHAWEHEVFVVAGQGEVEIEGIVYPMVPESVVFVPPNLLHQFRNTGQNLLRFLCLIPIEKPGPK